MSDEDAMRKWLDESCESILLMDGFDEALMGYAQRVGDPAIAIYDREICIQILSRDMSVEEAEEYFEFNVVGAWVGDGTPCFLVRPPLNA